MTDSRIARRIRMLPVVLALLTAGLLAAIVLLGAPATSSAAPPTYTCTNGTQTFTGLSVHARHRLEQEGFTCTKE